jgi:hypothetical protein
MRRAWPRVCVALFLAVCLAGCVQPTPHSVDGNYYGSMRHLLPEESDEDLPGGVVPTSYRITEAQPASREMALAPAQARPPQTASVDRPQIQMSGVILRPVDTRPMAELMPITVPGVAITTVDDWRLSREAPAGRHLAEIVMPHPVNVTAEPVRESMPEPISTPVAVSTPRQLDLSQMSIVRRQVSNDPTANPAFAHAADYSWIVGILEKEPGEDGGWSVRYAGRSDGDPYDGVLALVGGELGASFRPGQLVRVEGDFVDPRPLTIKPDYRVRAIQQRERP